MAAVQREAFLDEVPHEHDVTYKQRLGACAKRALESRDFELFRRLQQIFLDSKKGMHQPKPTAQAHNLSPQPKPTAQAHSPSPQPKPTHCHALRLDAGRHLLGSAAA